MKEKIVTKFGNAKINQDGYYEITSTKEGNYDKLLHRLIYMDYYDVDLPREIHVHHKNGLKTDNRIENLEAINCSDHCRLHRAGVSLTPEWRRNLSRSRSSTNVFRVTKQKDKSCKQGFLYAYQYYDEDNRRHMIKSTKIENLRDKVLDRGLEWLEFA